MSVILNSFSVFSNITITNPSFYYSNYIEIIITAGRSIHIAKTSIVTHLKASLFFFTIFNISRIILNTHIKATVITVICEFPMFFKGSSKYIKPNNFFNKPILITYNTKKDKTDSNIKPV